ncbi:MAG: transmembrane 220 family protein [Bacteroidota bacterium]
MNNLPKIVKIVLAALFVLFAYFQLNDPGDSTLWIAIYLGLAALYGFAAAGKYNRIVLAACGIALLGGIIYLFPSMIEFFTNDDGIGLAQTMNNDYPYIEEARECGGLMISLAAIAYLWKASTPQSS